MVPTLALGATGESVIPPFVMRIEVRRFVEYDLLMLVVLLLVLSSSLLLVRQLSLARTLRLGEESGGDGSMTLGLILKRMRREWRALGVLLLAVCLLTGFFALGPFYIRAVTEVGLRFELDNAGFKTGSSA